MNRAKRKYLLKLLRSKPVPVFDATAIIPFSRAFTVEDLCGKVLNIEDFISKEDFEKVKELLKNGGAIPFSVRYPAQAIGQHVLGRMPEELSITFTPTHVPSEAVRKMALERLNEMFWKNSESSPVLREITAKHAVSPLTWYNNRFAPIEDIPVSEEEADRRRKEVLAMAKEADATRPYSNERLGEVADKVRRIMTNGLGKRGGNIQAMKEAMAGSPSHTGGERLDAVFTPSPAIDACGIDIVINKDRMAEIQDIVKSQGLVKAFGYRPMPTKPTDYTEYCARSALNELKEDKDE